MSRRPLVALLVAVTLVTGTTWLRFAVWMGLGFVLYFAYGRRRSRVGTEQLEEARVDLREPTAGASRGG